MYLVSENYTVRFAKLEGLHWRGNVSDKSVFIQNTRGISRYLFQHDWVYKSKLTPQKFAKNITNQLTFTFGCGLEGNSYSKEARLMKRYVESENKKELTKWLRFCNTELQAYAATGLTQLKNKGVQLECEEKKLIERLNELNPMVQTCSGCIYGLVKPFKELLTHVEQENLM